MEQISEITLGNFRVIYLTAQMIALTILIIMASWIGIHLGGFDWRANPAHEFNWHPFLMTTAMIFIYGNSILIYRVLRRTRKKTLKLIHASMHGVAFILVIIGLVAVFDSHNLAVPPIPNLYSMHSWLGLGAVILFACQLLAGFVSYLLPGMPQSYKESYMPFHVYFGLAGFLLSVASALIGLSEKAAFAFKNLSELPNGGLMANCMAVLMVLFAGLVTYLATDPTYKRQPLPEDAMLLTNSND